MLVDPPPFDNAESLERMVDPGLSAEHLWEGDELRDVLEHQLAAPLVVDLQVLGAVRALQAARQCDSVRPVIHSFDDLFHHESPPELLLRMVSEYGHCQLIAPEPHLPRAISHLLFLLPLLIARSRLQSSISTLADRELLAGGDWLVAQPWIDQRTRQVISQCLSAVLPAASESRQEPEHGR